MLHEFYKRKHKTKSVVINKTKNFSISTLQNKEEYPQDIDIREK